MTRTTRKAEIRAAVIDGKPGVTLKVITPGIVDDYGSVFMPDAFDESIAHRYPTLCWAHDWSEPLGPAVAHRAGADGSPEIDFLFSDFEAVPMARRAHAQVADGTIRDCSVGFTNTERRSPTDEELQRWPGAREVITRADLDEVSLVLRGAVPGARVLSSRGAQVPVDAVVELARRVSAGEITADEAQVAIRLLETEAALPAADGGDGDGDAQQGAGEPAVTEPTDDDVAQALEVALSRSRGG